MARKSCTTEAQQKEKQDEKLIAAITHAKINELREEG